MRRHGGAGECYLYPSRCKADPRRLGPEPGGVIPGALPGVPLSRGRGNDPQPQLKPLRTLAVANLVDGSQIRIIECSIYHPIMAHLLSSTRRRSSTSLSLRIRAIPARLHITPASFPPMRIFPQKCEISTSFSDGGKHASPFISSPSRLFPIGLPHAAPKSIARTSPPVKTICQIKLSRVPPVPSAYTTVPTRKPENTTHVARNWVVFSYILVGTGQQ